MTTSSSSAFEPHAAYKPELLAKVHSCLTAEQIRTFDVSQVKFRACVSPSELDEIRQLHEEWFPVQYGDDFFDSLVSDHGNVITILAVLEPVGTSTQESIIGMMCVAVRRPECKYNPSCELGKFLHIAEWEETTAYVLTLGVVDELRKRGVARKLLDAGMREIQIIDPNCKVVYLHVIEYNRAAMRLYRSYGFTEFASYDRFYVLGGRPYKGVLFYREMNKTLPIQKLRAIALLGAWISSKFKQWLRWTDCSHARPPATKKTRKDNHPPVDPDPISNSV